MYTIEQENASSALIIGQIEALLFEKPTFYQYSLAWMSSINTLSIIMALC